MRYDVPKPSHTISMPEMEIIEGMGISRELVGSASRQSD